MCLPSFYAYESGSCPIFSSITYCLPGLLVDMLYASFSKNTDLYFCIVRNPAPSCFFFTFGFHGSLKFLKNRTAITMTIDVIANQTASDLVMRPLIRIYLSIYLFIYIFIYLFIYLFVYLFIYLFIYLLVYLFSKKTDVKKYKF